MWASGAAYEPYVGRWSRRVARAFVAWLAAPPGCRWLDVGCGTGALADAICALAAPSAVRGLDTSADYLAYARDRLRDPRVTFAQGDAARLPYADGVFDCAVSGLTLNFLPEPARGLAEMARVTRAGGLVATYLWDYAGAMQLLRYFWDAAVALDPTAADLDEGRRFSLCQPEPLAALFRGAGLTAVAVRSITVPTPFRDFDDYWTPFLGGQGPAPSYVRALPEPRRTALREQLRARLPIGPDGSIALHARAWAAQGRAP
jgi:SAM-dependent methyltransferase